jgi:hypothetical protein
MGELFLSRNGSPLLRAAIDNGKLCAASRCASVTVSKADKLKVE